MSAKFAKDLKAKGKKQYTETLNDLNEDAQADRDELVRNLTDLLEEYKLLDPTPEELELSHKRQEKVFIDNKKAFWATFFGSIILALLILSNFSQAANPDMTHIGRVSKYDPTKLTTHYNKLELFWQFRKLENVTDRIPPDRRAEELEPCGSTAGGKWPNCLSRCLESSECSLEENYFLDCFPTCPQIELSGQLDARFYIKRYSSSNAKGYFKQQIEILENQAEIDVWEKLCKLDADGSCTDLTYMTNKGTARVYMEACDVPLDTTILLLALSFLMLAVPSYNRIQAENKMLKEYMRNHQLEDISPLTAGEQFCKRSQSYALFLILVVFVWHVINMISVETCRYKQPELYNVGMVIIYAVCCASLLYVLFFTYGSTNGRQGYKLSRTGIAIVCSVTFLFPFYEAVFFLNHTICIIKEPPEGITARGCTWILYPIGTQLLFVFVGMAATATSNRLYMMRLYSFFKLTCVASAILITPYLLLFMNVLMDPDLTENYLTVSRDQYCFQKNFPEWPKETATGRWDDKRTPEAKYVVNKDGKETLARPSDYDLSIKGSCMPHGIQPWDIFQICNEGMEQFVNYTLSKDPNKKKPFILTYDLRFQMFSCRLCKTTKSCSDSGTAIFKQDGNISNQNAIICTLSLYSSIMGYIFALSILRSIKKELASKQKKADESFKQRLKITLGCRPSEIRWREELGLPHQWQISDEEFFWEQYFRVVYDWRPDNLSWRNAITSTAEWRSFAVYGTEAARSKARERVFRQYIEGVMAFAIVDSTANRNWEKLQPAKGPVMPLEKKKMKTLQAEYSAKYNKRWNRGKQKDFEHKERAKRILVEKEAGKKSTSRKEFDSGMDGEFDEKKELLGEDSKKKAMV